MRHRVRVDNPHPHSLASLVQLNRTLRDAQVGEWLEFRSKFLAYEKTRVGNLVCVYCGRENLVEEVEDGDVPSMRHLATVDHVVPRSKGGAEHDYSNLVVACWPCNQHKADKL